MVIVFAAGNAGPGADTVGTPGTAKNVITVGASENVQAFGGADQCGDGRRRGEQRQRHRLRSPAAGPTCRRPQQAGPRGSRHARHRWRGPDGRSARRAAGPTAGALCFDATGVCGGPARATSSRRASSGTPPRPAPATPTPAVAGGAALVRQYFINQGMAPPSPAMTKAYLMNSARYMTGSGANDTLWSNNQGMGLMDLGMAFDGMPRPAATRTRQPLHRHRPDAHLQRHDRGRRPSPSASRWPGRTRRAPPRATPGRTTWT